MNAHRIAHDVVEAPALLAQYSGELEALQEAWPAIRFHALREHASRVFQARVESEPQPAI